MASTINGTSTGSGGLISTGDDSGILNIQTNETTAITITAAQNIGIGTATPTDDGGYGKIVDIYGSTGGAVYLHTSTATNYAFLGKYNSSTQLADSGSAGLTFATASGSTPVERMRITSSGSFRFGTIASDSAFFRVENPTNSSGIINLVSLIGSNANNTSSYHLIAATGGADKCYILGNGNLQNVNNSYGALSDVKLKENIVDATPKLANLMQVKVRNYNLKSDPTHKQIGVIAQELEQVFPSMIEESPDRDTEGNILETTTKAVKYSVFVPMLIKAIQEQQTLLDTQAETINALTARIVALEGQ